MLETLITAKYLTDQTVGAEKMEHCLDRYFRSVRRDQVKLRNAICQYPALNKTYAVDMELAEREQGEYKQNEESLPPDRRLGRKHWSGRPEDLKSVAETVGLGADYAVQYRLYSGSTHGNRPWDQALFDPDRLLVVPSLEESKAMGSPLAFDALCYLTWVLKIAQECGAVRLYRSEQGELRAYEQYMEPMEDDLHEKGIAGAG